MRRLPQILAGVLVLLSLSGECLGQRARATTKTPSKPQRETQLPPGSGPLRLGARWSAQPGVTRYRFQLARDRAFRDIVLDRVVSGTEYEVTDITPGKYFWRVAPLDGELGQFSAPQPVEPHRRTQIVVIEPPPARTELVVRPTPSPDIPARTSGFVAEGGWRAAIGNVARPVLAHLRSPAAFDLLAMNSDAIVFAIDSDSGVTLWATRSNVGSRRLAFSPIAVSTGAGLDNVLVGFDGGLRLLHGAGGRELWRVNMTSAPTSGVAIPVANRAAAIFVVSNSALRLVVLDSNNGKPLAESKLPARVFGPPVPFSYRGIQGVLLAYEDGRIEIRDQTGNSVRSGNAQSAAITPPLLVVQGSRGLVLVGTKNGLTALDADDLRALGRVAFKDDAPRGFLAAADLDGDGTAEVIMITQRGQVMAINAADGKIRWEWSGALDAEAAAFADLTGDGGLDVIVAAGQTFSVALSGRDGSVIWKSEEPPGRANHAPSPFVRMLITKQFGRRVLIAGGDPSGGGLRAVQLSPDATRPK